MATLQMLTDKGIPVKEAKQMLATDVFGSGFKRDRKGVPIEQGMGAECPTPQDIAATEKYMPPGPERDAAVKAKKEKRAAYIAAHGDAS